MTRFDTKLAHLGRDSAHREQAVNPPVVRASTTLFKTVDEMRAARRGVAYETTRYGIYGTSTTFELQTAMAELTSAETCLATASGLMAITSVLGAHARPGARILIQSGVYEPTRIFADHELAGICEIVYFEGLDELEALIDDGTSLVFIEVPTSLTMRVIDVGRVVELARARGIPVACDSTWGTPLFFDAHALGIDISIHAATKYIGGHSDIMLGLTTGSYEALASTRDWATHYGSTAAPDVCWLGLRGLRTLAVRLERHQASARRIAEWLEAQPQVVRVLYPALPSDPDHELWRSQFSGAPGLLSIELHRCTQPDFERFIESLQLFGLGASWGGFESLVLPVLPHEQRVAGGPSDEGRLARLHIGLEDPDDLIADLGAALAHV